MLIILTFLHHFFLVLEVIVVTGMVLIGTFLILDSWTGSYQENKATQRETAAAQKERVREMLRKEDIRRRKETDAHKGFFEESYVPGFDSDGKIYHLPRFVPSSEAMEYYRLMDEMENTQQFNVVEELYRDLHNTKDQ